MDPLFYSAYQGPIRIGYQTNVFYGKRWGVGTGHMYEFGKL
jgi:hypothetical protein